MQDDLKERQTRALELSAQGVQRAAIALRCGLTRAQVRYALDKARAEGDARARPKTTRATIGGVYGVPRDLAEAFRAAASARGLDPAELRTRILDVVTRDDLFDALDLGAEPRKRRRR